MKFQKLFFYLTLAFVALTFKGETAGRQALIEVESVTVYADGELSSPGTYRATQDLIRAWGKQNTNLAKLIVGAPNAEARLQILESNREALGALGINLSPLMALRPPRNGAPARAESLRRQPSVGVSREATAATRIQDLWRRYQRKKAHRAMFAAVDENDPDLQKNYEKREGLIQQGMPLVRDLQDYDNHPEIEAGMSPEPRRRSPSPVRGRRDGGLSEPTEADWALLDAFVREHKDTPLRAIPAKLKERDPGTQAQLCRAIQHPGFYERAKNGGMGLIKTAAMVTFCAGVEFDRSQITGVKQRGRSPSPVRERVELRPVVLPQGGGLESQQQAFTEAIQTMEANAAILGRQEDFQRRLSRARAELIAAGESYDNLTAAVLVMKADLPDALKDMAPHFSGRPVLAEFIANYAGSPPDEYIDALMSLITSYPEILHRNSRAPVIRAHELLGEARGNLQRARQDLERINREMLQLVNQ